MLLLFRHLFVVFLLFSYFHRQTQAKRITDEERSNTNRFLIGYHRESFASVERVIQSTNGTITHRFRLIDAIAVILPTHSNIKDTHNNIVSLLSQTHGVRYIEPDTQRYALNNGAEERPWGVTNTQAPIVWNARRFANRGKGVTVCVIDGGLHREHEDFDGLQLKNLNDYGEWKYDGCNHGNHVSGTIGSVTYNNKGVQSVAPESSQYIVRYFSGTECRGSYTSGLIAAGEECIQGGAKIISMSLGASVSSMDDGSQTEKEFWDRVYNQESILPVAAAGNDGNSDYTLPGSYSSVLCVAASDRNERVTSFSQFNDAVDIAAPGKDVKSTTTGYNGKSEYETWDGTSMATPHVSAVAALLWSANPSASARSIRYCIESTAKDIETRGKDDKSGNGLIQGCEALKCITGDSLACDPQSTEEEWRGPGFGGGGSDNDDNNDDDHGNGDDNGGNDIPDDDDDDGDDNNDNDNNNGGGGNYATSHIFDESVTPILYERCSNPLGSVDDGNRKVVFVVDEPWAKRIANVITDNSAFYLRFDIEHSWLADLEIRISHDSGQKRVVFYQQCGDNQDMRVVFSDIASQEIGDQCFRSEWTYDNEYLFKSVEQIGDLFGDGSDTDMMQGRWTITITDIYEGESGEIGEVCFGWMDTSKLGGGTGTTPVITPSPSVDPESGDDSSSLPFPIFYEKCTDSDIGPIGESNDREHGIDQAFGDITNLDSTRMRMISDGTVKDVHMFVRVNLRHSYIADLRIALVQNNVIKEGAHPWLFFEQCGGSVDMHAIFTDAVSTPITDVCRSGKQWTDADSEFLVASMVEIDTFFAPDKTDLVGSGWRVYFQDTSERDSGYIEKACVGWFGSTTSSGSSANNNGDDESSSVIWMNTTEEGMSMEEDESGVNPYLNVCYQSMMIMITLLITMMLVL